jgi:glycosyltransferase involved in cell wall biosynthesis
MKRLENTVPRRTLFLSYLYPSFYGTGTQIRAAALLQMLAAREDVFLLVVHPHVNTPGPRDIELEGLCKKISLMPFVVDSGKAGTSENNQQQKTDDSVVRTQGELVGLVQKFYEENQSDSLFVFRFESCFLIKGNLSSYPRRYLDLDEFPSRRIGMLDQLKTISSATVSEPTDKRFQMAIRMMEKDLVPQFERTFVSSEIEAVEARRIAGPDRVHVLPNIFPYRSIQPHSLISQPQEILFVGSFFHPPNVDAVLHFCREIFPLIRQKMENRIVFRIVGISNSPAVAALAENPGVEFMGYQKDLEPLYASASLVVVPLRAGAGTRVKILEAFVYGRPVVSTAIGAAGLRVTDGENILLADVAEDFAQACVHVLKAPELSARLIEGGQKLHREHYSAETLLRLYDEASA